jgi:hypothetical protein
MSITSRNYFWGVKRGSRVKLTSSPPSVSECIDNVGSSKSQTLRAPRSVTKISLLLSVLIFTFVYVDHVRTSRKHVQTSTACYRDSFYLLCQLIFIDALFSLDPPKPRAYQTTTTTNKLHGFSPQEKYTDWTIATCRQNLVPTFAYRGVLRGQGGGSPPVVNPTF